MIRLPADFRICSARPDTRCRHQRILESRDRRSLMVWRGFPNLPGCVKEGTSGLGNPLLRLLLSTTAD